MSLFESIKANQLTARKAKDDITRSLLTTLMSEALMVAKNDGREAPTDDEVVAVVRKFLKGNTEVQSLLTHDLEGLSVAKREAELLSVYLPQQLTEDQIRSHVRAAIGGGLTNVGLIMGHLKYNFAGMYDGKTASKVIKEEL
jgi:uncharacterized protein YqeY